MDQTRRLLYALAGTLLLGACGQSGPLYLPGNPSRVEVEPPAAESGTDEIVEDEETEARE